ncbi:protoporphyrinogen oxidase [Marinicrinis sediminis]|uniref:Coproporphyrinogen III oxidase n=1 Tax=Marinicrinis sediminis TaxID=1652465 RepID=A0ABW5R602_9BACL
MTKQTKQLIIVGGGITGLSAAFYAGKKAREAGIPVHITILDKGKQLGGKIETLRKQGFVIEKGPDSFLARKLPMIELARELNLEQELVATNPKARKNYILQKGKLKLMPPGLVLGIPTQVRPFISTNLISMKGKARAAMDLILPRKKTAGDESLGHFIERRLGREVLDNIAEPLLAGIYAGDTYKLSLGATFPQFQQLEQKYRSLIMGMVQSRKQTQASDRLPDYAKNTTFLTFRNGLSTLVEALEQALEQKVEFRMQTDVQAIETQGSQQIVHVTGESGPEQLTADALIVTVPGYGLSRLFPDVPAVQTFADMEYVSVANVVLAYEANTARIPYEGSGFVIPRTEGRFITACTWTSVKWPHTAQDGRILLRCYVGRSGDQRYASMTDEELVAAVRRDVAELMDIQAAPLFSEVTHLKRSLPQYPIGHRERMQQAREALSSQYPMTRMTGATFEGVGLPDCIAQGKEAAEELVERLNET